MKRVVDSNMVAHLWANQSQDEARNAGGNLYFEGATIYSYGSHFPIARHVTIKGKPPLVLFTTRGYSNTTARHLSIVRHAISHLRDSVIECHNPVAGSNVDHMDNLKRMRADHGENLLLAVRARSQYRIDTYVGRAESLADMHTRYREAFGKTLDKPLLIPKDWKADTLARVARLKVQEKKRDAQLIKDTEEVVRYWKQGQAALLAHYEGKMKPAYDVSKVPVALRVAANGEEIETTKGARVPIDHARHIWGLVQKIQTGQHAPYRHNGHTEHVGNFRIDEIEANGTLHAGCHTIKYEAMGELANQLGWI